MSTHYLTGTTPEESAKNKEMSLSFSFRVCDDLEESITRCICRSTYLKLKGVYRVDGRTKITNDRFRS